MKIIKLFRFHLIITQFKLKSWLIVAQACRLLENAAAFPSCKAHSRKSVVLQDSAASGDPTGGHAEEAPLMPTESEMPEAEINHHVPIQLQIFILTYQFKKRGKNHMAWIKLQQSGKEITEQLEVAAFLESEEVIYEHWDVEKLPENLRENFTLGDEDKEVILETFKQEIREISERRGYKAQDVISLSDSTPNLDTLLENFKKEHHHTDDEVRFIVSGHGIFVIQGKNGEFFEVNLDPGDLISVPENTRHYFTLQEDRKVVAIRIFVTSEGWVPIYDTIAQ